MAEGGWQTWPQDLAGDEALSAAVVEIHRELLDRQMAADPLINRRLEIQQRALRHVEGWRVLLLLTPWMLSRLLFPDGPPALRIPDRWSAGERREADYQLLGPRLRLDLLGQAQQAHLNYHPRLGHYLLQPICLNMAPYISAEAVFEKWHLVIRRRDESMAKARRDCPLQQKISRRELFARVKHSG